MTKGFTLIEVLIAMSILAGIVFIVSIFGLDIFNFQIFLGDVFTMQQEINLTLTGMGIEIRAMGPSANGSYPVESASSESLIFYSDIDGDNVFERIRYFVSGSALKRGTTEPTGNPAIYNLANEISTDVVANIILPPSASQPLFIYYDQNYTGSQPPLSSPIDVNKIRLIRATVTTDKTPQDQIGRTDYSSTMLIRNLRNVQ